MKNWTFKWFEWFTQDDDERYYCFWLLPNISLVYSKSPDWTTQINFCFAWLFFEFSIEYDFKSERFKQMFEDFQNRKLL